jgi:DNA-binding winged helix-turn-helix (wHTH) protein/TolB-like protein/tetratricopeptide (TPR) repeat protein
MSEQFPECCYEFGPFSLDTAEGQLWRDGEEIQLTRKSFKVLMLLVENSGHVLDKNELMEKVWPDTFVDENRLADNISTLRKLLGDDPKAPTYIRTISGRGYRFVADVRELVREDGEVMVMTEQSRAHIVIEEDDGPANGAVRPALPAQLDRPHRGSRFLLIGGSVLVLGLIIGVIYLWRAHEPRTVSGTQLHSVAVLPFKPLVASERDESLEIGMADTLITRLSNINQLTVRPTSSIRKFADPQQDSLAAGRELRVDSVLDGNIQKVGDQLRLTARLVRVSDGSTIWADKFDTQFTNILSVQDDISEKVARALAPKLSGEEKQGLSKRYTDNVEAYQLYLQGRYHWSTLRNDDITSSINYYRAALEKDPNYALAYSGMADSYTLIGIYGTLPAREAGSKALEAARKAVELDDQLAQAHIALGVAKMFYDWDWDGARRELERGIQLNPNTDGHTPYGYYLYANGRSEQALAELKRASELAPTWKSASEDVWWMLYAARQYDEAAEQCQRAIKLDPKEAWAYSVLGQTYAQKQMYPEAIENFELGLKTAGEELRPRLYGSLGYAFAKSGQQEKALAMIKKLKGSPVPMTPFVIAEVYAGFGDNDQAFAWLDQAYMQHYPFLFDVRVVPQFDPLRSDPRYAALLRRMNLSP